MSGQKSSFCVPSLFLSDTGTRYISSADFCCAHNLSTNDDGRLLPGGAIGPTTFSPVLYPGWVCAYVRTARSKSGCTDNVTATFSWKWASCSWAAAGFLAFFDTGATIRVGRATSDITDVHMVAPTQSSTRFSARISPVRGRWRVFVVVLVGVAAGDLMWKIMMVWYFFYESHDISTAGGEWAQKPSQHGTILSGKFENWICAPHPILAYFHTLFFHDNFPNKICPGVRAIITTRFHPHDRWYSTRLPRGGGGV